MRRPILKKLILLIMLLGCLLGALSITSFSAEPKEQVLIDLNTEWRYLDDDTDPAAGLSSLTAWTRKDFDDSKWKTGVGSFGTKKGSLGAINSLVTPKVLLNYYREGTTEAMPSYFFRTTFTVESIEDYNTFSIDLYIDDSACVYINGKEFWDSRKTENTETNLFYSGTSTRELKQSYDLTDKIAAYFVEGENVIAVELHNEKSSSSDAYFGINSMSLSYVPPVPTIADLVVLNVGADETERNLAWFSTHAEAGEVRVAKSSQVVDGIFPSEYTAFPATSSAAVNISYYYAKKACITGLEENTEYSYVIALGDTISDIYTFGTKGSGDYTFVYVGDPQITKEQYGNEWKDTLEKIKEHFDPSFVLSGGDQVNTATDEVLYSYLVNELLSTITFAPTVGPGHDSGSATFSDHFTLPNLSDSYGVGKTSANYWYTYNNTLFMHLNMEDNDALYNGEHEAFITEAMAANPDVKWTILVAHRAPFSTGMHGDPNYKNYETEIAKIRPALSALATRVGVDVVLSAHDHVYVRTHMMINDEVGFDMVNDNRVVNPEGILYITANSSTGSKFYDQRVENAYFVATENYEKRKSAIRFEVTDTTLTLTSYFLDDMSVFDTFTIEKKELNFTPDGNLVTPYGIIHEDYADKNDYPVAVFDKASGTFLGAYPALNYDLIADCITPKSNVVVYLRADATTGGRVNHNVGQGTGIKLIDLDGHTLTLENTLFYAQAKKVGTLLINVQNGTIVCGGNTVWKIGASSTDGKAMNITFENVTFRNIEASLVSDGITPKATASSDVTFNDCAFVNVSAPLLELGNESSYTVNVAISGGYASASTAALEGLFLLGNAAEKVSFVLSRGADGNLFKIYAEKTGADVGNLEISLGDGKIYFTRNAAEESATQFVYTLIEKTPYGNIEQTYLDAEAYPIVVFYKGKFLFATDVFESEETTSALGYFTKKRCTEKDYVIYLRRDYNNNNGVINYVLGNVPGNVIIDLGGNTFTLARQLLLFQTRASGTFNFTIKNGTIKTNGKKLYTYGYKKETQPIYCLNYENIVFDGINGPLNGAGAQAIPVQVNIEMRGCTFNVSSEKAYVFSIPAALNQVSINIKLLGSTFNFPGASLNLIEDLSGSTESIISWGEYNGKNSVISTAADADAIAAFTAKNADGAPLALRKTAENTYELSPFTIASAYLNIADDLNLIYRVFLPHGYENPTAIFTIDGTSIEVTDYTLDENGLYLFKLVGIGPHKMADTVCITVSATIDGKVETVTNDKMSVKTYIDKLRADNADNEELNTLLDALLVYGAAAQVYMNYNVDNLVAEIGALESIPEQQITISGEESDLARIAAIGVRLDNAFDLRLMIEASSLEGLVLEACVGDKVTEIELREDMMVGNRIVVYYDGLLIQELDTEVTFTLKQNGVAVGKSITFSASAYLYEMQTSENTALANLTKALYAFATAAKDYAA